MATFIKPKTEILDEIDPKTILEKIEKAGRTCYKSEDKITEHSCLRFVDNVIRRGHESVIEHEKITAKVICDRGVTHEIVRHRIASYSQESTRYCNYKGGVTFIIPHWIDMKEGEYHHKDRYDLFGEASENTTNPAWFWFSACIDSEVFYQQCLQHGWTPQMARSVLPNSLKTEIVMTMNLREWRHFFKLRTAKTSHPQMREIAIDLFSKMKNLIPVVFDDITWE